MTLSTDVSSTLPRMQRGKAGQTSRVSLAGVLVVQRSCRFRLRGDPKTRPLHRRHTGTSNCHHSLTLISWSDIASTRCPDRPTTQNSNITRRTSSGSTSIVNTRPTSHRISQQSLGDDARAQQGLTLIGKCEIVFHQ